jgi:ankyrin repeat protein
MDIPIDIPVKISATDRNLLLQHTERTKPLTGLYTVVLQLITHANRPLRLLEIADFIKVTKPEYGTDIGVTKDLICRACGTLLEVRPDQTVCVKHQSIEDYLLRPNRTPVDEKVPVFEPGTTHDLLASLCLSYLQAGCLDAFDVGQAISDVGRASLKQQELPPFLSYAATNWHVHSEMATKHGVAQEQTNSQVLSLLTTPGYVDCLAWLNGSMKWKGANRGQNMTPETEALLFSIRLGLSSFIKSLLRDSDGIAVRYEGTQDSDPPLHQAVVRGNVNIVRLLTRYGARPTQFNSQGATPLHLAVGYNSKVEEINPGIVQHLLEAGADPWQALGEDKTLTDFSERVPYPAIEIVLRSGNEGIAKLLLPYIKSEAEAKNAFTWAVNGSKNLEIIRSILNLGLMDINAHFHGQTPLFSACLKMDPEIISLLLKAGSNPNVPLNHPHEGGANVLHALASPSSYDYSCQEEASENVTRECFRLVLAGGANG